MREQTKLSGWSARQKGFWAVAIGISMFAIGAAWGIHDSKSKLTKAEGLMIEVAEYTTRLQTIAAQQAAIRDDLEARERNVSVIEAFVLAGDVSFSAPGIACECVADTCQVIWDDGTKLEEGG
jgi:hypothetical protein